MTKRPPLRPGATRRAYINRTTKPKSSGRPKARNAKRKAKEFARAYGGGERVTFVRALPCLVCGRASTAPCENAHIVTGGMGRKADAALIVPLCSPHHQSLHARGRAPFEDRYGVDLGAAAVETEAKWQAYCAAGV